MPPPLGENFSSDHMEGAEIFSSEEVVRIFLNLTLTVLFWSWNSLTRGWWYPSTSWKTGVPFDTLWGMSC